MFLMMDYNNLTDKKLISLIEEKNAGAFDYIYTKFAPAIYGTIKQSVSDASEADGILLKLFIKCFSDTPPAYQPGCSIFLHLYRNAMELIRTHTTNLPLSGTSPTACST